MKMIKRGRPKGTTNAELGKVSKNKKLKILKHCEDREDAPRSTLYAVDERVLCYEPDPLKCKVLYDAKVLKIATRRDDSGTKQFEYLIHFQGWNSSWDRFVADDLIMKDNEENRILQDQLNSLAACQRKKGKQKNIKRTDERESRVNEASKKPLKRQDKKREMTSRYIQLEEIASPEGGDDHGVDEYNIQVTHTLEFTKLLDLDWSFIHQENKLPVMPSPVTVDHIIEKFMKSTALQKLERWFKKYKWELTTSRTVNSVKPHPPAPGPNNVPIPGSTALPVTSEPKIPEELSKIINEVDILKQLTTDLQLMFDMYLEPILLYNSEKVRHDKFMEDLDQHTISPWTIEVPEVLRFTQEELSEKTQVVLDVKPSTSKAAMEEHKNPPAVSGYLSRRSVKEARNGGSSQCNDFTVEIRCRQRLHEVVTGIVDYHYSNGQFARPSLIYGMPYLLRLLSKMPEVFVKLNLTRFRFIQVSTFVNELLNFILDELNEEHMLYEVVKPPTPVATTSSRCGTQVSSSSLKIKPH